MTLNEVQMRAYREARDEGLPPVTALYAAREPVLNLDWNSHYQVDGEWAEFTVNLIDYKVFADDAARVEGRCSSCWELVEAWRRKDDDYAWITDDEYVAMDHRYLTVTMLDTSGEETPHNASLWGVCGLRRTPTEIRMDDRYVAETVMDLVTEVRAEYDRAELKEREAQLARETRFGELIEELTAYAETLAGGHITRNEYFDRATRLVAGYIETEN